MPDYSLVPVNYPPEFEDFSRVPVDYNPFDDDGVAQEAQAQQEQTQPAHPPDQPQQPTAPVARLYVGRSPSNTQSSEPTPSIGSIAQPPASTSDVVKPQQVLQGAINQFYPGAQFSGLAQQAYKDGQYGNAIGYGVGAVADSLLALTGGKLALAGGKFLGGASSALLRALVKAGETRPVGYATHHIVAKEARFANPARVKLQELGIGIHDAVNGVFLEAAKHGRLHDKQYYEAVNKALASAKSKAEAEQILKSIGERLK